VRQGIQMVEVKARIFTSLPKLPFNQFKSSPSVCAKKLCALLANVEQSEWMRHVVQSREVKRPMPADEYNIFYTIH